MGIFVGINLSNHPETGLCTSDGGVAIAIDGVIRYACAEERVSRSKYDGGFQRSLSNGLAALGLTPDDIDAVGLVGFGQQVTAPLPDFLEAEVRAQVGPKPPIFYCASHHEGHAWAAIGQLTLHDALIVVIDHTGSVITPAADGRLDNASCEQTSYYLWRDDELELVGRDHDGPSEVGYGRFYSKVTRYVGFGSYHDAGKLMGLAPFGVVGRVGSPMAYKSIDGAEVTAITNEAHSEDGLADLSEWLGTGGARPEYLTAWSMADITAEGADLAAWGQYSLNVSVLRRVQPLVEQHRPRHVIVCGGVALNSVLNGLLDRELSADVRIPDSPGDAGLSVGALQFVQRTSGNGLLKGFTPFLGRAYTDEELRQALTGLDREKYVVRELDDAIAAAASALADGLVIGWFRGPSEFGPRALGNRSILCGASNPWVKEKVNGFVKRREWFRPFAPSILAERAGDYFEMGNADSPYMMKTVPVHAHRKHAIPSAVHVDGTARVQTVSADLNPDFHALITAYDTLTGVPVLLNTSFNEGGLPLIDSPDDAISAFVNFGAGMDILFLGSYAIRRA